MTTLEKRRLRGDLIETFKVLIEKDTSSSTIADKPSLRAASRQRENF